MTKYKDSELNESSYFNRWDASFPHPFVCECYGIRAFIGYYEEGGGYCINNPETGEIIRKEYEPREGIVLNKEWCDVSISFPSWWEGKYKQSLGSVIENVKLSRKYQNEKYKEYRKRGVVVSPKYNKTAMDKAMVGKPVVCVGCGDKRKHLLQRHHIDGNYENNESKNLEWRCLKCHAEVRSKK